MPEPQTRCVAPPRGGHLHVFILCVVVTGGCAVRAVRHEPPPPAQVPEAFAQQRPAEAPLPERWWRSFEDAALDGLVDRALGGNFQLRAAWARLDQAGALARQGAAPLFPSASVEGAVARTRSVFNPVIPPVEFTRWEISARAAYELDVWGRLRALRSASALEQEATRDDLSAAAITVSAETTEAWFDVLAQRAQRELVLAQLRTNEAFLELVTLRFEQGLVGALDVWQQRQQVTGSKAQVEVVDGQLAVAGHRLAVLLGAAPGAVELPTGGDLPALPPVPEAGVPAHVLARRPDIRAAQKRVEALDHRVTVALAELLPALRLSGSAGYNAFDLADLFKEIVFNAVASVAQPVFEGGRRVAELDRARAAMEERLQGYGQVVLQALLEVENALALERQQSRNLALLETQLEQARAALDEARSRYREGLTDYLPVLTALQARQRLEQGLISARRQLLSHRVQLHRALGGNWTEELVRPEARPAAQASLDRSPRERVAARPGGALPVTDAPGGAR